MLLIRDRAWFCCVAIRLFIVGEAIKIRSLIRTEVIIRHA
jgi:hypothetical protein